MLTLRATFGFSIVLYHFPLYLIATIGTNDTSNRLIIKVSIAQIKQFVNFLM